MILSDIDIYTIKNRIKPFNIKNVGPASYDITLSTSFSRPVKPYGNSDFQSLDKKPEFKKVKCKNFILMPGEFALGSTVEEIHLPAYLAAKVEGRSGIGRLGLFIQNAGYVDPGFKGTITLEFFNASNRPIVLTAGRRIGQLVFEKLTSIPLNLYNGHYQGQKDATPSRVYKDDEVSSE